VLIAAALLAMLLSAVAIAMQASVQGYRENEHLTAMTQAARSVLARMMREIRTADEVDSTSSSLTILPPVDGSGMTLIQYTWAAGQLNYSRTTGAGTTTEVLLGGNTAVSAQSFTITRETGTAGPLTYTKTVTATITFAAGGRTFDVTASADVRRNQEY
jgi:type II secretory pathway pseudopilin PulG